MTISEIIEGLEAQQNQAKNRPPDEMVFNVLHESDITNICTLVHELAKHVQQLQNEMEDMQRPSLQEACQQHGLNNL